MARIRSIHPGIWTDEAFVSCSPAARLLHIGLWNEADDGGAFEWKPLQIKMRLAPADAVDVSALLRELEEAGMLMKYQVGGKSYGAVRNFGRFQSPKKPRFVHPMPNHVALFAALSGTKPEPDTAEHASFPEETGTNASSGSGKSRTDDEPVQDEFRTSSPPSPPPEEHQSGTGSPKDGTGQPDGIGIGEGREKGSKEDPCSLRSHGAGKPPPEPPDPKAELWRAGLASLKSLIGQPEPAARRLLGRLVDLANHDHERVYDAIRRAEQHRPDDPVSWLTAAVKLRSSLFVDPDDECGIAAWIESLPDTKPDRVGGKIVPCVNGWGIAFYAKTCATEANLPAGWRGKLDAIAEWARADIDLEIAKRAIREQVERSGGVAISSMAFFDQAVRQAAGKQGAA